MPEYVVVAVQDARQRWRPWRRWWLIYVSAINQYTQARSIREIEPQARDLIACCLDIPIEEVSVRTLEWWA